MTPTIYFCGSIRGGRADAHIYGELIALLQARCGRVLTEHVGLESLAACGEATMSEQAIYDRGMCRPRPWQRRPPCSSLSPPPSSDMQWLLESQCVVAECTVPSLGVGYEVAMAITLGKPVLCLYRPAPGRCMYSSRYVRKVVGPNIHGHA